MKCKISAANLKGLVKSMGALQSLGVSTKEEDIRCLLTVRKDRLYFEGANMGAYVRRNQGVAVLRDGSCGVNLKVLAKSKFSGEMTLDFNPDTKKLRIFSSRTKFDLPTDQTAHDIISSSRPDASKVPVLALVPTAILSEGAAMVALKPGLKEEDLRMQFSVSKGEKGGRIEIVGIEHYSYARYVKESPEIKVKEPFTFILQSSSPSLVLKEITAAVVGIGVEMGPASDGEEAASSRVRFTSDDAEVIYPTLGISYLDAQAESQRIRAGTFDCGFVAYRKQLREAVNTLKPVQDSAAEGIVLVQVTPTGVELGAKSTSGMVANARLDTTACKTADGNPRVLRLSEKYFSEVLTLASDIVPLRVESWDRCFLSVTATKLEDGEMEFFFSQIVPSAAANEEESK